MKIAVYGLGYVGCVNALCATQFGHTVYGIEKKQSKLDKLDNGTLPIFEPGLHDIFVKSQNTEKTFSWHLDTDELPSDLDVFIISVGTPAKHDGSVELTYLDNVIENVANNINRQTNTPLILLRSTVPPGTCENLVIPKLEKLCTNPFEFAFYPEFLREGNAIDDFFNPSLNVVGTANRSVANLIRELTPVKTELKIVDIKVSEMIKYVNNSYHALKVCFANEIGQLCNALEINSQSVMDLFKQDKDLNISDKYFNPGAPFGGTCLTKELKAISNLMSSHNIAAPMLSGVQTSNDKFIEKHFSEIEKHNINNWGVVGLAFKPNTGDTRESSVVKLLHIMNSHNNFGLVCFDDEASIEDLMSNSSLVLENFSTFQNFLNKSEGIILGSKNLNEEQITELKKFNGPIIDMGFFNYNTNFNNYTKLS